MELQENDIGFMKFHTSPAAGLKSGQSNRKRNFLKPNIPTFQHSIIPSTNFADWFYINKIFSTGCRISETFGIYDNANAAGVEFLNPQTNASAELQPVAGSMTEYPVL